jgi:prepilin-type N-terminal cleavage/methylation domain-containing protein
MPTSSVGATSKQRGVTLLELLIVVTLIALVAGVSYPSVNSGLDSMRLRSASDAVAAFLTTAVDRAGRRQQAIEIVISPRENVLLARTADQTFLRRVEMPDSVRIVTVAPPVPEALAPDVPRRFLVYPGGAAPRIGVEIASSSGRRWTVSLDPITGIARSEPLAQ